jgi:ATP-dependent RNA helicase DeaD
VTLLQRSPRAVVGSSDDLLALVRSATLKLEHVQHVIVLWADALLTNERQAAELDTLLGETARDGDRTVVVEHTTPAVEAFLERAALKPRRLTHAIAQPAAQRTVGYVIVAAEQRAAMLQRLLDTRDPSSVAIVADDELAARHALDAITALGMDVPDDVTLVRAPDVASEALIVWYGPPESATRIAALTADLPDSSHIVLLTTAAELRHLKSLSNTLLLTPESLPHTTDEAAQRQRLLRDELAATLRRESVDAELALLDPLLAQHDAAELAAAALRLLARARHAAARAERGDVAVPAPRAIPASAAAADQHWTRLFISVGERDGARRGDLVGAITGEAGITGAQVGKIEMRETYSLVDIATPVADRVVQSLTGVSIRGRRVTARLDRAAGRSGVADPRRSGGRRDAPAAAEPAAGSAGTRPSREQDEWATRAERLRHARRPPPGGNEP